jgi:hypothetical protein
MEKDDAFGDGIATYHAIHHLSHHPTFGSPKELRERVQMDKVFKELVFKDLGAGLSQVLNLRKLFFKRRHHIKTW